MLLYKQHQFRLNEAHSEYGKGEMYMSSSISEQIKGHPIVAFYILAFAISWLGYLPQVAYTHNLFPFQSVLFFIIGGIGPTIAAISVIYILHGKNGPRKLFKSFTQWRISIRWYIVALFGYATIWFVAIYLPSGVSLNIEKLGSPFLLLPLLITNFLMNM